MENVKHQAPGGGQSRIGKRDNNMGGAKWKVPGGFASITTKKLGELEGGEGKQRPHRRTCRD